MTEFFRPPHVTRISSFEGVDRVMVVRSIKTDDGLRVEALNLDGEWVERSEGFVADGSVVFELHKPLPPSAQNNEAMLAAYEAFKDTPLSREQIAVIEQLAGYVETPRADVPPTLKGIGAILASFLPMFRGR